MRVSSVCRLTWGFGAFLCLSLIPSIAFSNTPKQGVDPLVGDIIEVIPAAGTVPLLLYKNNNTTHEFYSAKASTRWRVVEVEKLANGQFDLKIVPEDSIPEFGEGITGGYRLDPRSGSLFSLKKRGQAAAQAPPPAPKPKPEAQTSPKVVAVEEPKTTLPTAMTSPPSADDGVIEIYYSTLRPDLNARAPYPAPLDFRSTTTDNILFKLPKDTRGQVTSVKKLKKGYALFADVLSGEQTGAQITLHYKPIDPSVDFLMERDDFEKLVNEKGLFVDPSMLVGKKFKTRGVVTAVYLGSGSLPTAISKQGFIVERDESRTEMIDSKGLSWMPIRYQEGSTTISGWIQESELEALVTVPDDLVGEFILGEKRCPPEPAPPQIPEPTPPEPVPEPVAPPESSTVIGSLEVAERNMNAIRQKLLGKLNPSQIDCLIRAATGGGCDEIDEIRDIVFGALFKMPKDDRELAAISWTAFCEVRSKKDSETPMDIKGRAEMLAAIKTLGIRLTAAQSRNPDDVIDFLDIAFQPSQYSSFNLSDPNWPKAVLGPVATRSDGVKIPIEVQSAYTRSLQATLDWQSGETAFSPIFDSKMKHYFTGNVPYWVGKEGAYIVDPSELWVQVPGAPEPTSITGHRFVRNAKIGFKYSAWKPRRAGE